MSRHVMIIDMDLCVGCGACVVACQEEWGLPEGISRNWAIPLPPVSAVKPVFTHYVGGCNHCAKATCLSACPTGATFRDEKGRIRVDSTTCIGCGYCVDACPYGARTVRKDTNVVEKCNFCAPNVDRGLEPTCVKTCPAGARIFGDMDDRSSRVSGYFLNHRVSRLETDEVSIEPQVFHAGKKEVVDRIFSEHPPNPEKTIPPLEGMIVEKAIRPGFLGLLALVFVGQSTAFFRQLTKREEKQEEEKAAVDTTLKRRDMAMVWLHWFNSLVWLFQIFTGFGLLNSDRYRVTPGFFNDAMAAIFGSREVMLKLHEAVGIIWVAVLLSYGIFGFKRYLYPFLKNLKLNGTDISWLVVRLKRMLLRSKQELPYQGMYNAGQKLFGIVVSVGTVLVIASGLVMYAFPGSGAPVRWSIPVHFLGAAMVIVGLVVHVYMAAFLPSERPALFSMFHGRIPESFARKHNRLWWENTTKKS